MSDTPIAFTISFDHTTAQQANTLAQSFHAQLISMSIPDVSAEVHKPDKSTMDLGTTIVLVLGTPVLIALAKEPANRLAGGIANWLARQNASISMTLPNGQVCAKGLRGQDAARIAKAIADASRTQ